MFMFIWIIYFALAYYILGSEIDTGDDFSVLAAKPAKSNADTIAGIEDEVQDVGNDYSDLGVFFKYAILAWRNSIGDLSVPKYDAWSAVPMDTWGVLIVTGVIECLIWAHWILT